MKKLIVSCAMLLFAALPSSAEIAKPYQGQQNREIKALEAEQIEGLLAGAGLGYAKAAELNGWPGPLHALELSDQLGLSAEQHDQINTIRQKMLADAQPLGAELIGAEKNLDILFARGKPNTSDIIDATTRIGIIEAKLRSVHLAAHIETKPILTRHQQKIYQELRGYSSGKHSGHHQH